MYVLRFGACPKNPVAVLLTILSDNPVRSLLKSQMTGTIPTELGDLVNLQYLCVITTGGV
jgi:hypothetical protein